MSQKIGRRIQSMLQRVQAEATQRARTLRAPPQPPPQSQNRTPAAVDTLEVPARPPLDLSGRPAPQLDLSTFKARVDALRKTAEARSGLDIGDLISALNPFDDTVAVFDNFGEGVTHGDDVEEVLQDNVEVADGNIRRIKTGTTPPPSDASLEERIEHRAVSFLDSTSDAMESVLAAPGNIEVINQSQSISPVRIADEMWGKVKNDPEKKSELAVELGLEPDASDDEILQALVDTVDAVFEDSEEIGKAKARYDGLSDQLEEQGILHVVTAGNTGRFIDELDDRGISYDSDFTDSVLFNENTLVIAASNGDADDGIAPFSTPTDYVTVAIDGKDIDVVGGRDADGTSFAAPQVTALIAEMRRINPDLTNDQIRAILAQASTDTDASDREEGAGILDPDAALALARASLLPDAVAGLRA